MDDADFSTWFGRSRVVDRVGAPLVVYHGTTVTRTVTYPVVPGDAEAKNKLKTLAFDHGIADYDSVPGIFERWLEMGMAASRGVTYEMAVLARTWLSLAKPQVRAPTVELGFDRFILPAGSTELGAHFGTRDQALARGTPFPFLLSMRNPLRLPDLGTWGYQNVIREARRAGVHISEQEYDQVFNQVDNNAALRALLMEKGIDGVVYWNEAEGAGDSYIAFDPDQIRRADRMNYRMAEACAKPFSSDDASELDDQSGVEKLVP